MLMETQGWSPSILPKNVPSWGPMCPGRPVAELDPGLKVHGWAEMGPCAHVRGVSGKPRSVKAIKAN